MDFLKINRKQPKSVGRGLAPAAKASPAGKARGNGNERGAPRSFGLFGEIGFLELCLCAVVGEEGTEEDHRNTMQTVENNQESRVNIISKCNKSRNTNRKQKCYYCYSAKNVEIAKHDSL